MNAARAKSFFRWKKTQAAAWCGKCNGFCRQTIFWILSLTYLLSASHLTYFPPVWNGDSIRVLRDLNVNIENIRAHCKYLEKNSLPIHLLKKLLPFLHFSKLLLIFIIKAKYSFQSHFQFLKCGNKLIQQIIKGPLAALCKALDHKAQGTGFISTWPECVVSGTSRPHAPRQLCYKYTRMVF